jgi:uncharacterized protein
LRVLALADRPAPIDPAELALHHEVAAVLCLGDLDRAWIESLAGLDLPRLGVHGNHDPPGTLAELGIEDLHMRSAGLGGVTFAGFEGCVRYASGRYHQYSQEDASRLSDSLPPADVLLCHCPPYGVNDDAGDPAHVGFRGLRDWVRRHVPRHLLHGHTHPSPTRVMTRLGETAVHWVSGAAVLELE